MFTFARLWYLDCQPTFLYCHFFNARFARLVPGSTHPLWTTKIDIAKFPSKMYLAGSLCCSIESLNLLWSRNCQYVTTNKPPSTIAPCVKFAYCAVAKFFALGRGGDFCKGSFCRKEKQKKKQQNKRTEISLLVIRKTDYFCYVFNCINHVTKLLVFEI